ncbi:hypothetical protein [Brevibacillus sp. AY1]|uniref:hypothetical protein n=1 Tax=Brevibacillus sp. AY1 TaxID=2807621 RepID=UPI0005E88FA9|nr:hypothetical protein [Brevibacillus sp. AY1]MDH4619997.1 hypothetical protein [Brevibacillus sp. AY1]CFJ36822.1 Uncharacterised protein [Mycobacterium tuberculosis]
MRTIKTIQDVRLIQSAQVFSDTFTSFLEEEFLGLKEAFDFDGLDEAFTLDLYGYMVVLEQGDNIRDLSVVGLDRETGGLLGSLPEFVDKVERHEETWYKVVVIYTNEYAMSFIVPENVVADDEELKTFLEAHVE